MTARRLNRKPEGPNRLKAVAILSEGPIGPEEFAARLGIGARPKNNVLRSLRVSCHPALANLIGTVVPEVAARAVLDDDDLPTHQYAPNPERTRAARSWLLSNGRPVASVFELAERDVKWAP
jgi:hypothetical protein